MATQTAAITAVDRGLISLALMLSDLPAVAEEWDELSEAERASWSLDWDQEMGALPVVLVPAYRDGRMTDTQAANYRELWLRLGAGLPTIRRLNLWRPPMALAPGSGDHAP